MHRFYLFISVFFLMVSLLHCAPTPADSVAMATAKMQLGAGVMICVFVSVLKRKNVKTHVRKAPTYLVALSRHTFVSQRVVKGSSVTRQWARSLHQTTTIITAYNMPDDLLHVLMHTVGYSAAVAVWVWVCVERRDKVCVSVCFLEGDSRLVY